MSTTTPTHDPAPESTPGGSPRLGRRPAGSLVLAERATFWIDGFLALLLAVGAVALAGWLAYANRASFGPGATPSAGLLVGLVALVLLAATIGSAVLVVSPGQTKVVQFFGRYVGTVRRTGLTMVTPFTTRRRVSVRVNNFETAVLKVNDAEGNPVEIAAIVVWQVHDTAKASFAVESYQAFVKVQSEAALRHVATSHPYDDPDGSGESLRGSTDTVSAELAREVADRVAVAGVEVLEVRISHLAYAPEIAQAMLQRQQAAAIIAARSRIVDGAVGMVEMALTRLEREQIVDLDDERKAAMVANLLVVLCGEAKASPVINAGTLYG
ncbi:MAG: SPFH domain-containing protein [Dermatophilaceae bacterium]